MDASIRPVNHENDGCLRFSQSEIEKLLVPNEAERLLWSMPWPKRILLCCSLQEKAMLAETAAATQAEVAAANQTLQEDHLTDHKKLLLTSNISHVFSFGPNPDSDKFLLMVFTVLLSN